MMYCYCFHPYFLFQNIYDILSEPNIELVVSFDQKNTTKRKFVSYSNRQLIAREIEMEKMRRHQLTSAKNGTNKATGNGNSASPSFNGGQDVNLPNHLQCLKAKKVKMNTAVSTLYSCFI